MLKNQLKLLKLINNYSKIVQHKVNVQKSITFLYTINEQVEFEIKNTLPFTLVPSQNETVRHKSDKRYMRSIWGKL